MLEVHLEYFPFELRTRVTRSDGSVWQYFYDAAKLLTKIVTPDGSERTFVQRPEDGQTALELDGAGNQIGYDYDADGRCVGRYDSLGRPILPHRWHVMPGTPAEYELRAFATLPAELPTHDPVQSRDAGRKSDIRIRLYRPAHRRPA